MKVIDTILAVTAAFVVGLFAMSWLMSTFDTNDTLTKQTIAECAIGPALEEDLKKLREVEGVARYRVTFLDGKYQSIECINDNDGEG